MGRCFRWIVAQKNRVRNGELYRYIADTRGAFVQPALYEGGSSGEALILFLQWFLWGGGASESRLGALPVPANAVPPAAVTPPPSPPQPLASP